MCSTHSLALTEQDMVSLLVAHCRLMWQYTTTQGMKSVNDSNKTRFKTDSFLNWIFLTFRIDKYSSFMYKYTYVLIMKIQKYERLQRKVLVVTRI